MGWLVPWALAGLVAAPVLLLLYLLRRRGREVQVPALFLWAVVAAPAAGPRVAPRRLPPVFWLELAAVALLVAAAAGPWLQGRGTRPLLVVLDPSYSMAAGGASSPRRQAEAALLAALQRESDLRVTLVLAGDPPTILGEELAPDAVAGALSAWRPEGAAATLDAVLRLAVERQATAVLVLTDGAPPADLPSRVAWWAFGAPLPNLAVVAAGRSAPAGGGARAEGGGSAGDGGDEVVTLEVANLGGAPAEARLGVRVGEREEAARRLLGAGETWRLRLPVPAGAPVHARLGADALPLDDEVSLPALARAPLGVTVAGLPRDLDGMMREALAASGVASLDGPPGAAVLAVEPAAAAGVEAAAGTPAGGGRSAGTAPWRVLVHREAAAVPYLGPFAVDRRHPLGDGLTAEGVVWAAGSAAANPPGQPVIAAGEVVLLADEERADGGHDLHLRLREDLSTLERAPAWPVLWWNLLAWRRAELPGPAQPVQRLGEVATLRLPAGVVAARARGGGWEGELRADEGSAATGVVRWLPPRPGEYRIEAGSHRFALGVGTLQRAESDLRDRVSLRRGNLATAAPPPGRRPMAWLAGMAALALLVGEGALLAARGPAGAAR